jgi:NAD(P)-dependent dehydrogenase (short-subunit alcohol dehydrogenase family)
MEGEASWYKCFELDVMGAVRGVEAALPHLEKSGNGSILLIGTTAAVETFLAPMAYNALKASLITYAKQLSQAVAAKGVRVNVVSPGPIYFAGGAWEGIEQGAPDLYAAQKALHPTNRMGTPEEVARAAAFLLSPAASWINGVNLVVDGGYTKRVQF